MKRRLFSAGIAALLVFASMACGAKSQTPTEGFKAFYEAAKNKDAAGLKKTISKKFLSQLESEARTMGKPFDEFLVDVDVPPTMPEVRNEKMDGDKATLEVKGSGDNWRPTKMVKEDGVWKLDSD